MNAAANARVALLALCVALFAIVWSGDQTHPRGRTAGSGVAERADSADSAAAIGGAPVSIRSDDVPLPAALAPGVYRIVGTGGGLRTARFTVDDLLYLGIAVTSESDDVPMIDDGLQRWYFIRLDEEFRTLSAAAASNADAPLCRATKLLLAWAHESAGSDLQSLADECGGHMAGAVHQWTTLARSAAGDPGIPIRFASGRTAGAVSRADAPFCRATKLLAAWAGDRGARDVRILAGDCDDYMADSLRQWQRLARSAADDVKQALTRVYRPAKISRRPRDDQRL